MKTFLMIFTLLITFKLSALEMGDTAVSVVLNHQVPPGIITPQDILAREQGKKFLLLEFMSITCKYCVENMPVIASLQDNVGDKATIKLISIDRDIQKVQEFISEHQDLIKYPFAFDNKKQAKALYNITGVPTIFIIDENMKIIYKHLGSLAPENVEEIKMILN